MNRKIIFCLTFLFLISIFPLLDLLHPGLPITHDGQDHVARIANFYQNLREGTIVPRWAGNLNWGYGHPILMFLYPLSSYTASLFHFLGFSLVDSLKLVFALAFVASGITMYLWLRSFLGHIAGVAGACCYMFSTYRMVDFYVRGAIGEHVAFVFPPLICFFLLKLARRSTVGTALAGAVSFSLLLLSHNAISIMFLPVLIAYATFLYFQTKKRKPFFQMAIFLLLFGFALASFFWIPAFFEGKYTLRDIVTRGEYLKRFEVISRFISSPWEYGGTGLFSVQIGLVQWLSILSMPFVSWKLYKKKEKFWMVGGFVFITFWIVLFLMLHESAPIWQVVTTLQKFQFPWRFLSLCVFLTAVSVSLFLSQLRKRIRLVISIIIVGILLVSSSNTWRARAYDVRPEAFYTNIYNGTTDTGESAPIWSVRFMEKRPKEQTRVIEGNATITTIYRLTTKHAYLIHAKEQSRILENTLFFPGWRVYVNDILVPMQFQDAQYRGLITYNIAPGKNDVRVVFSNTKLRTIADTISLCAFVLLVGYSIYCLYPKKKKI